MVNIRSLWAGDLPLETAFWSYAVFGGTVVNVLTSVAFLTLIGQDKPLAAVIAGYALSIPYNTVATVGVWRAAARDHSAPNRATAYRLTTLIGMLILSLT